MVDQYLHGRERGDLVWRVRDGSRLIGEIPTVCNKLTESYVWCLGDRIFSLLDCDKYESFIPCFGLPSLDEKAKF